MLQLKIKISNFFEFVFGNNNWFSKSTYNCIRTCWERQRFKERWVGFQGIQTLAGDWGKVDVKQ